MENPVRITTKYRVDHAHHVVINHDQINHRAELLARNKIAIPHWPNELHLTTADNKTMLTYIILLDALNFCFWFIPSKVEEKKKEKWHTTYRGKTYSGYNALAVSLKKFFEEHPQQAMLKNLAPISFKNFKSILSGTGELLLLKVRWHITCSVATALLKKYKGDPENLIRSANKKLSQLVPTIAHTLPSFNDTALYKRKKIYFLKRAQILAADIWGAFNGTDPGEFHDPEYLTAFADYRLPQILHHWKILEYSPALKKKILRRTLIKPGTNEEIEIRAATIWAVEYLHKALTKQSINIHPFQVDWLLWNAAQATKNMAPHHLTKTVFY